MKSRELAVPGAWEITPQIHTDTARPVLRMVHRFGVHRTSPDTASTCTRPTARCQRPGYCAACTSPSCHPARRNTSRAWTASVFDVVVDIRIGSPTFGTWDATCSTTATHRSDLPLRRAGPCLPRPRRQLHSDVPVLSGLRPRPRAHHQRPRPRTEHRLAHHPRPTQPVRARPPSPHPRPSPSRRPATDMGRHPRLRRRPTPRLPLNVAVKLSILHSGS